MFKKGDLILYMFIVLLISTLSLKAFNIKEMKGSKVEIYVNNKLKSVYNLSEGKKNIFIPTDIGGVDVVLYNNGVEVTSSNSPKKLVVKQGFIDKVGQTLIGVPDKLLIKIVGNVESDLDFIVK